MKFRGIGTSARVASVLAALGLLAIPSFGHEEKDPVCGMAVEIEKAPERAPYAGKNYYFCSAACLASFRTTPEKYVSALRLISYRGKTAVAFTLRPRSPKIGDLAKFYLQVGLPLSGEMGPDPKTAFSIEGFGYLYDGNRAAPARPEIFRLHQTDEPGTYGFSKQILRDAVYRVFFVVRLPSGEELRAGFDCPTEGAMPKDDHGHSDTSAPAGHSHPKAPAADAHGGMAHGASKLTMEAQHETMRRMGEHWAAIGETLFAEPVDSAALRGHVEGLSSWARNIPEFMLHKFEAHKPEFLGYGREFASAFREFERAIEKGDRKESQRRYVEIDGRSCTKCHLKFRWGVVEDLSGFPDLRRKEHGPQPQSR